jgi:(p)ppGpp synthase/HD superfamily hydrolase
MAQLFASASAWALKLMLVHPLPVQTAADGPPAAPAQGGPMPSSPWSPDRYLAAHRFAAAAHHGQTLPSSPLPYILHPTWVAMEVTAALAQEGGRDGDFAVACALLHDVLEDTSVGFGELACRFGRPVAEGVDALSKRETMFPERETCMADTLRRIRTQPAEVAMVKLADRIVNLQPPPAHWEPARVAAYRREAQAILKALEGASPWLARRLADRIAAYPKAPPGWSG